MACLGSLSPTSSHACVLMQCYRNVASGRTLAAEEDCAESPIDITMKHQNSLLLQVMPSTGRVLAMIIAAITLRLTCETHAALFSAGPTPTFSARGGHAMVECGGSLHVTGGHRDGNSFDDVYSLSSESAEWNQVVYSQQEIWGARHGHQLTRLPNNATVITGGSLYYDWADAWLNTNCVSAETGWTAIANLFRSYPGRAYHQTVFWKNQLILIGGGDFYGNSLNDVWSLEYNSTGGTLAEAWASHGNANFEWRSGHATAVYNDTLYLMGGSSYGYMLNDVWFATSVSDALTANWQQLDPSPGWWAPRSLMVVAVWEQKIVLAGGIQDAGAITTDVSVKTTTVSCEMS
jgi:hypothetical protein